MGLDTRRHMNTILGRIVERKRQEIVTARERLSALEHRLRHAPPTRDFRAALDQPGRITFLTEIKKASPSAGVIRADFDPVAIARTYELHGADAISVLTDETFFQGSLDYLAAIRRTVSLPLLRKDFILDRVQLLEARCAGADAALLIAEILPGTELGELVQAAHDLGLQTLTELYDPEQLPRVLACGTDLVGINNRDLRTFETRLEHTLELLPRIPPGTCLVSESGIRSHEDIVRLHDAGVHAVLVGEVLMRAGDIGVALDSLRGSR